MHHVVAVDHTQGMEHLTGDAHCNARFLRTFLLEATFHALACKQGLDNENVPLGIEADFDHWQKIGADQSRGNLDIAHETTSLTPFRVDRGIEHGDADRTILYPIFGPINGTKWCTADAPLDEVSVRKDRI